MDNEMIKLSLLIMSLLILSASLFFFGMYYGKYYNHMKKSHKNECGL
jgi:VIT1/CCC1 family predicted Fe2+/Mn2+ transporter